MMTGRMILFGKRSSVLALIATVAFLGCPKAPEPDPLPTPSGTHLLRFVHISDTQIVDEESPARVVRFAPLTESAWRPQEAYGIQTLDATLRVVNSLVTGEKGEESIPIDFVIATGDLADSSQHNELRWFIDTMDGLAVLPDSGDPDGALRPLPAEDNPKLLYQAEGLDASIPWYTVFGNHDGLASGTLRILERGDSPAEWTAPLLGPVAKLAGFHRIDPPQNKMDPVGALSPAIILGSQEPANPETLRLPILALEAGSIVPDPDRYFINRAAFIEEHFDTTTQPIGHGFTEENRESKLTRYTVRPDELAPVRIIVMDTVAPNPIPGLPAQYGVMTQEQFNNFVKPEIEAAQEAGEFVLLASHHPSADFDIPYSGATVTARQFRRYLAKQPNIIAHVCGHTHQNFVQRFDGDFPYYEIQTGAIIDYPQEGRILDIYWDESTSTMGLASTMFSHMDNPTVLSEESFRRAEIQAGIDDEAKTAGVDEIALASRWSPPLPSKAERFGTESDRNFRATFPRWTK